jgi:hypothetical protein
MQTMFMKRAMSGIAGAATMAGLIVEPAHHGQDLIHANDN